MSGVSVKWTDRDGLQIAIKQASAPPNSRILAAVAGRMRGMQVQHFADAVDSSGKAWKPLKAATIKQRRMSGAGGVKILQDDGFLKGSIVKYSDRDEAITGTNKIYAATHQFGRAGGGWHGSDIPAREFIYLNDAERVTLVEFITKELIGPLMKSKN